MSLEESNKMSQKNHSQDSNSDEIEWKLEDLQKAITDSAAEYDRLLDAAGQHALPNGTAEAMWEMERSLWSQRQSSQEEHSY